MKIVLLAAGGHVGSRVAHEAASRGHAVTGIVRDPARVAAQAGVTIVQGDATDAASIATIARGADAILSTVGPNNAGGQSTDVIIQAAHAIIAGARLADVKRVIVLGGAGSLEVAQGVRAVDTPEFPDLWKANALAQGEALDIFRSDEAQGLDWTYISPAAIIAPGPRTGAYRVGAEEKMLFDAKGDSKISIDDYAVAMIDELESGKHIAKRITVAY